LRVTILDDLGVQVHTVSQFREIITKTNEQTNVWDSVKNELISVYREEFFSTARNHILWYLPSTHFDHCVDILARIEIITVFRFI